MGSRAEAHPKRPSRSELRHCRAMVGELVARIEPLEVPASEAPVLWTELDQIERLVASAKTLLAARVDDSGEWKRAGHRSAAEHLAQRSGTTVADAKATLEVSRAVGALPGTKQALRAGELSTKQAAAVAGAALADPAAEPRLLGLAADTTVAALREECLRTKAAADPDRDATHRRIYNARRVRQYTDSEGAWNLAARGTPELGARVNTALEPLIDEIFTERRNSGERESRDAYAFDALVRLADRAVGRTSPHQSSANAAARPPHAGHTGLHETALGSGSQAAPGAPAASQPAPRTKAGSPKHLAILRLDLEALVRGRVEGTELCEIAGLGPIPVRVARELLGESVLKLVLTKGRDVANVTHLGRGSTAAQKVALLWQQPNCTAAGCVRSRVEIDHRHEYATTRQTCLHELDPLCKHHHQLKTNHNWALVEGQGTRDMVPPDHPRHPKPQRAPRRIPTRNRNRARPPPRVPSP